METGDWSLLESRPVQPVPMNEAAVQMRLQASISGLADRVPLVSARSLVTRRQRNVFLGLLVVLVIGAVLDVKATVIVLVALTTLAYLVAVVYRAYLFTRSSKVDALEIVTEEEALAVPDSELPSYTIMIPAYREASVITKLIENLTQLDYPTDRLEVLILVEGDDEETLGALRSARPPDHFHMVVVPPAEPRTKPKALNFGLTLARGDIVAVYDVEDTPDVLQLRRAAVALESVRSRSGLRAGEALVRQRDTEHHHQVVHHRIRDVVLVLPARSVIAGRTDSAGGNVEPFPPRCPSYSRGMGPVQRH